MRGRLRAKDDPAEDVTVVHPSVRSRCFRERHDRIDDRVQRSAHGRLEAGDRTASRSVGSIDARLKVPTDRDFWNDCISLVPEVCGREPVDGADDHHPAVGRETVDEVRDSGSSCDVDDHVELGRSGCVSSTARHDAAGPRAAGTEWAEHPRRLHDRRRHPGAGRRSRPRRDGRIVARGCRTPLRYADPRRPPSGAVIPRPSGRCGCRTLLARACCRSAGTAHQTTTGPITAGRSPRRRRLGLERVAGPREEPPVRLQAGWTTGRVPGQVSVRRKGESAPTTHVDRAAVRASAPGRTAPGSARPGRALRPGPRCRRWSPRGRRGR